MSDHQAEIVYPGAIKGRPTIELRLRPDGGNEAFLVPTGGAPVPTGVSLEEHKGKYRIRCRIRKKMLAFKPEEVVRQMVVNYLIDDLGYDEANVGVEVGIVMGSTVHPKPADIVVFSDENHSRHWIIVETKQPRRKDGIEQLKSYMNATGATFGYWSDGLDSKVLLRSDPNDYSRPILRIPRAGESLSDVDEPLTRSKLTPVKDLYAIFEDVEQEILAHQSVDTFEEIFKVVFAKLYDERVNLNRESAVAKFRLGLSEDPREAAKMVKQLFEKAKRKWRDVYDDGAVIQLHDDNIAYCIKALQQYHLIRSGDVLGVAFELLVNQEMKGDMGQYFTPRQVVDMMVDMLRPGIHETVCDPACGSGGFLIYSLRRVFSYIESHWDDPDDRAEQRKDYAQENVVGSDNDPRLVRVAKAYMIMENDGRSGVFGVDSLDYQAWDKSIREAVIGRKIKSSEMTGSSMTSSRRASDGVDVILTNPPFAGAIKAPTTLNQYQLSLNEKGKAKKSVVRAILFIERCIDMLKPGGRMGIVLPQGLFNNITDQPIRSFIDDKARVLAVVGLHSFTFKPFTLAKTSVLFVRKWNEGEYQEDYPVFTAVSMRPGKTKLGRPQLLDDGVTLDCDMPEIADAFLDWARSEGLAFADQDDN
ncbi:MAG: N-6 DNA methylase [Planctomycetota bacterium]